MGEQRAAYATDLIDVEWAVLAPFVPPPKPGGRRPRHPRREILDALAYWLRAGVLDSQSVRATEHGGWHGYGYRRTTNTSPAARST